MRITDHQLDASKTAGVKRPQKIHPEGFGLGRPDSETDNLSASIRIGGDSDYGGYRYDPTALSLLEIGGVEPDIGPFTGERAVQELVHPLVDVLAELGDSAFRDAAQPHGLHQIIDPARRHAADPRLLYDGDQGLLGHFPGLQEAWEVNALSQLWNFEVQCAEPGVERAFPVAIPPGRAVFGPFMPTRADKPIDVGLHDQLEDRFGYRS